MLTSSDAKFRCLWYMVVWSILLMIVSQFFRLVDHIAFYVFASAAMLLLPFVTSLYSTTAGRHGAGLLRVSYIFCDPVLACVTVIPVLLLNRLPRHLDDFFCLEQLVKAAENASSILCANQSSLLSLELQRRNEISDERQTYLHENLVFQVAVIQVSLLAPSLLTLAMGRRSRKMSFPTVVIIACYWLIAGIETAHLVSVEVITMATVRRHVITSTAAIVAIAMILSNSYAVVTLCSYICPADRDDAPSIKEGMWFDTLYRCLMGGAGILFAEIPLLAAHAQVIAVNRHVPATFYTWIAKDVVFILVAIVTVVYYLVGARRDVIGASCGRLAFDNPDVFFLPEKRDAYIVRHQHISRHVIATVSDESDHEFHRESADSLRQDPAKKKKRVTFRFDLHHGRHGNSSHCVESDSEKVSENIGKVSDSIV